VHSAASSTAFPTESARLEAGDDPVGNSLVDARPAGCIAMVAVCHDVCSPVLPVRGEIVKEGISPLALSQLSFVECPRFMSCAEGRGEAGSVNAARSSARSSKRQRRALTGSDRLCHKTA